MGDRTCCDAMNMTVADIQMAASSSAIAATLREPGRSLAQLLRICGGDVGVLSESRRRATRVRTRTLRRFGASGRNSRKEIVDAAAPTIQDVLMKVAMTASLLSEGELWVGLTPQCLEECDRALAQEGHGEQCLKALEPELWALCQRVQEQTAALEIRDGIVSMRARKPGDQTAPATASHSQRRGTSCTSLSGA